MCRGRALTRSGQRSAVEQGTHSHPSAEGRSVDRRWDQYEAKDSPGAALGGAKREAGSSMVR